MFTLDYRPFSFDEMVGQKKTIHEMKKRSRGLSFPEVMIFEGESGSGKTTLAFIIAALINDPDPIKNEDGSHSPNPKSPSSISIRTERFDRDVYLKDASTMGKDDVIALEELLSTGPLFDKKKVVIIDEAQELSKAGKGVALKLLEKKRKNVHLILCTMDISRSLRATMDISKFDKAVQSRGQVYKFRPVNTEDISNYLIELLWKIDPEGKYATEEFLKGIITLANNSNGNLRTAVQNFERCINGEFFTQEDILEAFGFISDETLYDLILGLLKGDSEVLSRINTFSAETFFHKAKMTLIDAEIYAATGTVDKEWKEKFLKQIYQKPGVSKLTDILIEVDAEPYFKSYILMYKLARFLKGLKEPPKLNENYRPARVVGRRMVSQ